MKKNRPILLIILFFVFFNNVSYAQNNIQSVATRDEIIDVWKKCETVIQILRKETLKKLKADVNVVATNNSHFESLRKSYKENLLNNLNQEKTINNTNDNIPVKIIKCVLFLINHGFKTTDDQDAKDNLTTLTAVINTDFNAILNNRDATLSINNQKYLILHYCISGDELKSIVNLFGGIVNIQKSYLKKDSVKDAKCSNEPCNESDLLKQLGVPLEHIASGNFETAFDSYNAITSTCSKKEGLTFMLANFIESKLYFQKKTLI